ncbi:S-2-hydroxy-acid oxidase [Penicillium angulare]|uniref:S-2-hydroxy-acid oxidase n=1 Tax=Penicillium angulare TaxID=116970 RepID=UPI0025420190|nr:S-2-hydroxy-acid oxidase [Penicillium angulare]KAJ5279611.1 S-2-hydroxy-acid oxidase [Penicillium angulare]
MPSQDDPITIDQVEDLARQKIPSQAYNYYSCGADDQRALESNRTDFDSLYVLPRVLRDVSHVDTSVKIFGQTLPIPIGIAPTAMQRLASPEGELDVSRAASSMGVNMTLSSNSTTSLEDVIFARQQTSSPAPPYWFQIYLHTKLELSVPLIKRAEAAGYQALVLTVDSPVLGNRINERKEPLILPEGITLANSKNNSSSSRKPTFNRVMMDARNKQQYDEGLREADGREYNSSLTWKSAMEFLRRTTNMKIIVKGIMAPEDAQAAIDHGADAIVVSNHGGRQLGCAPSTIKALPEIVDVAKGRIPVIFDGGVRRGSDVFKALALGADFVLVGRPVLWGLGYKGREGVETVMNILERELSRTMALAGTARVQDINASFLRQSVDGRLNKL